MKTQRWVAALAASALVAAGAVGAGSLTTANADTPTNGPGSAVPAGDLYLSTISQPTTVSFVTSAGSTASGTEKITVASGSKCKLATSGTSYLTFASSTSTGVTSQPGYALNSQNGASIGVQSNKENGLACSQVNDTPGESLTVNLNNQGATSPLAPPLGFGSVRAKSADLDLNLAGNAIIKVDLYRGTQRVGGAELQSGFSAVQPLQNSSDQLFVCSTSSNSGPQSVSNNNCYWNIVKLDPTVSTVSNVSNPGVPVGNGIDPGVSGTQQAAPGGLDWDSMVLTAVVGAFSIQGGGQWPASLQSSRKTHFALESASDGTLSCSQTTQLVTTTTNGDVTSIQVSRIANGASTPACSAINYTLSASNGTVTFHKQLVGVDGSSQSSAQFEVAFVRTQAPTSAGVATYPTAPKVDWEDSAVTASGSDTVDTLTYCPASVFQPGPSFTWPGSPSALDMSPLSGTQYACLFNETQNEQADGSVAITDQIYLTGDVYFTH